jgi:methionyl-tRNA formyltransferase
MRIVFLGTGEIGVPTLEMLFADGVSQVMAAVTQPDKPAGRRQELRASAIKILAQQRGVPVLQPAKIREAAALDELRTFAPEVLVVMAYGQILPQALLDLPSLACLNLHASLLPRHRGAAPIQAAIEAGDRETGITVMYMAAGLDTGDILLQRRIEIDPRETGGSLHDRLALLAPGALAEALALLGAGRAPRVPQDEARATYAAKLTREHGQIAWAAPAEEIDRKIRAMNPWPAASTILPTSHGPQRLKVFAGVPEPEGAGAPGEVLGADARGLLVAAGRGAIRLEEVQLEGKRRMHARELLQGHPVARRAILGLAQ